MVCAMFAALLLDLLIAASAAGQAKVINPKGQEAGDLVRQVMKTYGIEQGKVQFRAEGTWVYASETSATVAMETTERAAAVLEYGETPALGKRLGDDELHYIHVFHLGGLKSETVYHFRMSAVDRNGNRAASAIATLKTRTMDDAVRIPDDLEGPPYELNKRGATYLVTKDITAPTSAFNITVGDVTLDLGGHTVTYNEEHLGLPTDSFNNMLKQSAFGVRIRGGGVDRNVRILNGTLKQGKGNDEGSYTSLGFNPIYLSGGAGSEIAGVQCIYSGDQMSGIICHWSGPDIWMHHNVVDDRGKRISNRHRKCSAIKLATPGGGKLTNNLVRRARQCAFGSVGAKAVVAHNEAHIDSYSINSFGIDIKSGSEVHHNRIFGCGDNVVGLVTTGGCDDAKLHDNYLWLHAHDIAEYKKDLSTKGMESSDYSIMSGARETWGCKSVNYFNNVILVTARDGGKVRGTFLFADEKSSGVLFRDNLVVAIAENEKSDGWGAIAGVGTARRGDPIPIDFRNNTVVSNFANFNMQDSYGVSNNYRFVGNKFVRVGDRADYATIRARRGYKSIGHVFLDSEFEGGASYDKSTARNVDGYTVQWTLSLVTAGGAQVVIKDANGEEVYRGTAPADGKLSVPLTQYRFAGGKRTAATPHMVTVTSAGKTEARTVTMEGVTKLEVIP